MKRTVVTHLFAPLGMGLLAGTLALGACKGGGPERPDIVPAPEPAADAAPAPEAPDTAAPAAEADAAGGEPFRLTRPMPRPVADLKLPGLERFTLASGLEVFLVAQDKLPTVFMSLEFDLGEVDDPAGKKGLASVCMDLFSEGTERLDKIAFAEAQADHAVQIWSPAEPETSSVNLRALERELGPALDLTAELLRTPGLRQEDFDRIIAQRQAALKQVRGTPDGVARRLFAPLVWGEAHPYGHLITEADLGALRLDDCKAFAARLRPAGARLWVVGKVTRERLTTELEGRLSGWAGEAPRAREIPPAPAPTGAIAFVQVDGAVQSMVMVGHPGPRRDAADYEAAFLMAQILGGSFSSRINMNLREDKGWAYGAFGGFEYARAGSTLEVMASVEASTTALALAEMKREIEGLRAAPPKPEELLRERDGALAGLPARFSSPSKTLEELKRLAFHGLPLDWFGGHASRLAAVDAEAAQRAAAAHLSERAFRIKPVRM